MSYQNRRPGVRTFNSNRGSANKYGNRSRFAPRGTSRRGVQNIDPRRFIQAATSMDTPVYQATHQFSDFDINPLLKTNLSAKGYVTPSPIQDQTIPAALEGKDIIGIANTGTGKTAAFAIPVLHSLMNNKSSRALIVAPTRELAQQIEEECRSIAKGSGLFGTVLIGGTSMGPQLRELRENPSIVIGTPGRIKDHIERRTLNLASFKFVVLDEVDRMLDMGFINDVRHILSHLSSDRQSFFFSATLDPKIRDLINAFSKDPAVVSLKVQPTSESVHQNIVKYATSNDKIDKLHDLLITGAVEKALVFDETQRSVERLHKELASRGFAADAIHGGKNQAQRQRALDKFKKSEIDILVATDVAARGIDVADITHVINYTVPRTYDDYVHRIGRAGRAGKTGHALTFVAH